MPLSDLFKSRKQREREERLQRRRRLRETERAVENCRQQAEDLKKESARHWDEARTHLKSGRRDACERALRSYRSTEMLVGQLEKKYWVGRQMLLKIQSMDLDKQMADSLGALIRVMQVDPAELETTLDDVRSVLDTQEEMEGIWDVMDGETSRAMDRQSTEQLPGIDDLMSQLEEEVVVDTVGNGGMDEARLREQIGEGRERLRKLMQESKK